MATLRESVNDGPMRDYLNPKSAITMGACAAMVLAFTTSLCGAFTFLPAALMALVFSVMFGWAQVAYLDEKLGLKVVYCVVCSLIIFNAARGGNLAITDASGTTISVPPATMNLSTNKVSHSIMDISFVQSAYAGPASDKAVDNGKYYFWRMTPDGHPVYTNSSGIAHTNFEFKGKQDKKIFKEWKWK
jgi:hypothetical protein